MSQNKTVKFKGIKDTPHLEPGEFELLEESNYGMAIIEHPKGFYHEEYGCNVILVDANEHLEM